MGNNGYIKFLGENNKANRKNQSPKQSKSRWNLVAKSRWNLVAYSFRQNNNDFSKLHGGGEDFESERVNLKELVARENQLNFKKQMKTDQNHSYSSNLRKSIVEKSQLGRLVENLSDEDTIWMVANGNVQN